MIIILLLFLIPLLHNNNITPKNRGIKAVIDCSEAFSTVPS